MTPKRLKASHVAIGTELVVGQTLNTNSHTMSRLLQKWGVKNVYHTIVPDDRENILKALELVVQESDWIFVYGGLGPTSDDFTRNIVAEWMGLPLVFNDSVWTHIQNLLSSRGYPIREIQKQQAFFPQTAKIMENSKGTAHGFYLETSQHKIFVLPGPPKEIQSIGENFLFPFLKKETQNLDTWKTQIWNTMGLGESEIALKVEGLISKFKESHPEFHSEFQNEFNDEEFEVGYRVHLPYVEVKISFFNSYSKLFQPLCEEIDKILKPHFIYHDEPEHPAFLKKLFSNISEIEIQDNYSQGLIFEDLKKWLPENGPIKMIYKNFISNIQSQNYLQIENLKGNQLNINFKCSSLQLSVNILTTEVQKLPKERQILYIKEKIYQHLLKLNNL